MARGKRWGVVALAVCAITSATVGSAHAASATLAETYFGTELHVNPTLRWLGLGVLAEPLSTTVSVGSTAVTVSDDVLLTTGGRCQAVVPLRTATCSLEGLRGLDGWITGSDLADRVTLRAPQGIVSVSTGGGNDSIDASGQIVEVECGAGFDTVTASSAVAVSADCESVTRI